MSGSCGGNGFGGREYVKALGRRYCMGSGVGQYKSSLRLCIDTNVLVKTVMIFRLIILRSSLPSAPFTHFSTLLFTPLLGLQLHPTSRPQGLVPKIPHYISHSFHGSWLPSRRVSGLYHQQKGIETCVNPHRNLPNVVSAIDGYFVPIET